MPRRFDPWPLCCVLAFAAIFAAWPALGVESTAFSAKTVAPGRHAVAATVGFPYLLIQGTRGLGENFDLSVVARSAWSNIQRLGLGGRYRFHSGSEGSAAALRFGVNGWLSRPAEPRWITATGEHDVSGAAALLYSWTTSRGAVMTLDTGVLVVGNRNAPALPLQGPPPLIVFGANVTSRFAAEIPYENGVQLTFDLGFDLHLSSFDAVVLMPAFSVGVAFVQ